MAYLNLEDFEKEISSSVSESDLAKIPITIVQTLTFVKLRVPLEGGEFIECYFNEITKRTSFALISRGKRIFGANNPVLSLSKERVDGIFIPLRTHRVINLYQKQSHSRIS